MTALTNDKLSVRRVRAVNAETITARRHAAQARLGVTIPVSQEEIRRYAAEGKAAPTR